MTRAAETALPETGTEMGTAVSGTVRVEGGAARDGAGAIGLPGRYVDLGPIAAGSFGEVRRVRDAVLGRDHVVKILHASLCERPLVRRRFFAEVRITARLQHPGVPAVYDHGELHDGRLWYAMEEVRGRTLRAILDALGEGAGAEEEGSSWTFRRVVDVVARVAQTVAYAHRSGVVHRDLKPDNVMVGELGEVMVMDWGLARRVSPESESPDSESPDSESPDSESPDSESSDREPREDGGDRAEDAALTRHGDVLGTPAYMPPEQALGARDLHGPASDVYALGAILYHVLAGRPPYRGGGLDVVRRIALGPPPRIREVVCRTGPLPEELERVAERAMERRTSDRPSAEELASEILAWLDGARRREQALSVVAQARALEPEIASLRAEERARDAEARALAAGVRAFDPVESKRPVWQREDERDRLGQEASRREAAWLLAMHAALRIDPDLPEANAALADHYRARVTEAEAQHRAGDAAAFEAMLRSHDRGRHAAFLRGEGAVTLVTDPPGAEVHLARYEERDRRLVPSEYSLIGRTPLPAVPLSRGSYLLRLRAPGRAEVRVPVLVERDVHWHGVAPGEAESFPIPLPREGDLDDGEVYVPAGPAWIGGHAAATDSLVRRRVWVNGFVIDRHPVTCAEWLSFLNDLVRNGREDEAIAACPRGHATASGDDRALSLPRGADGLFTLTEELRPDAPIMRVDWHAAVAYARHRSARTGRDYRLPSELEREKAARGVDERLLPWGDHPDATFACVADSHRGELSPARIHEYPADESPYGVRGLAGNMRDHCLEVWRRDGPTVRGDRLILEPARPEDPSPRAVRGGAWGSPLSSAWSAGRFATRPDLAWKWVGVRLCRSWPPVH
ncbi:MAG: SUMF1/EgtB/PvdO family nonheme iron enzyme [Polyangiaceae bacterium]